ncbi:MAG: reverse transcriptase domain-containing protein, partial [Candidatus Latescibacterota bacterium]
MPGNPSSVCTKQQRLATLAKRSPQMAFTSLAYLMDLEWLREAYRRTRKDAAPGVDGQTAEEYARNLETNLASLLDRAQSGTYWAPPVRRVYIPKGTTGTETRPIGIPAFEDKVLQRAVVMLLEPIYEQDFLDCSYGFRPRRSAHDALAALWKRSMDQRGGWVIELDIRRFFDTVVHGHLRDFLQQRVRDGVLRCLVDKWLKAGVLEDGELYYPEDGTPQGGVISPLAANVYLHEVLDRWFEEQIKPRLRGSAFLIRYADDAVLGFTHRDDAERVLEVLPKRFARYGLQLHTEKTRLVPFEQPGSGGCEASSAPAPGCFDFLAFRHYWGRSRQGRWVVKRK